MRVRESVGLTSRLLRGNEIFFGRKCIWTEMDRNVDKKIKNIKKWNLIKNKLKTVVLPVTTSIILPQLKSWSKQTWCCLFDNKGMLHPFFWLCFFILVSVFCFASVQYFIFYENTHQNWHHFKAQASAAVSMTCNFLWVTCDERCPLRPQVHLPTQRTSV